jgi:hypothetical protein
MSCKFYFLVLFFLPVGRLYKEGLGYLVPEVCRQVEVVKAVIPAQ